jgi:hypothetical protein
MLRCPHALRSTVGLALRRLGMVPEMEVLPAGKFRCIVVDPPWLYSYQHAGRHQQSL